MPNYFGQFEIVAETKNFIVTCDGDAEARVRAQNVAGVCESDLRLLNDLFSTNFEAGNTSDHTIWVNVLKHDPATTSNGFNYGYETEESSRIVLPRAFLPPPTPPPPADPPPVTPPNFINAVIEFPRFVFVAELAEILMDFTGYGWGAGNSMGEGLSNLLGALLHPAGYYDTNQGPRINPWLNGGGGPPPNPPRADFVTNTENTDKNIFSYGCAILFVNYLVSQLGHPLKNVIRAGGGTLSETYSRLTGQGASAAFPTFNALLQKHIGSFTSNNMLRDNIFPLFDPAQCKVVLTVGQPVETPVPADPAPVSFEVKPGIACPADKYDFFRQHQQVEVPIYARARGTASAVFRWEIEGVTVAVRNQFTNITVNVPSTVKNPDGKTQTIANMVAIQYGILDTWNGSVLYLKTLTSDGNCSLKITAAASEGTIGGDPEVSASDEAGLTTVFWLPGVEMKKAWKRCNPFYGTVDTTLWGLSARLSDLKNRPDPPSERTVLQVVEAVHQLDAAVVRYAKAGHLTTTEVMKQIGTVGGLRSKYPLAAEPDLTRLRIRTVEKGPESKKYDS